MKKNELTSYMKKLHELIDIGVSLSSEKELSQLLGTILRQSCQFTQSKGAHIYLVHEQAKEEVGNVVSLQKEAVLRFVKSYNCQDGISDENSILKTDSSSIAGHVYQTKDILRIEDCYKINKKEPYQFNNIYDANKKHKTKSMLTLPLVTADGKVKGVLQLINKLKPDAYKKWTENEKIKVSDIIPFTFEDEELLHVFTSYITIALENSQLTESIENLFESFVRASIKAIEARDPTTSGHSDRVAMMTVELALATHKIPEGPFKDVQFSEDQIKEIRYASLLHDFGKIGVTEQVLLKKKKLQDRDLESVLLRFDTLCFNEETRIWKDLCERLIESQRDHSLVRFDADQAFKNANKQIEMLKFRVRKMRSNVITANEPQVMSEDFNIDELISKLVRGNESFNNSVLTQDELKTLSIPRGSLNHEERKEIESHVSHTYDFLKQIAWTDNLSHITTIAYSHHEKLDGSGYPRKIKGDEIPIQSRMMTIADIYDALTAFDRPYKKSLPAHLALEIRIKDARANKIDGHLLKIFIEAGIFHNATLGTVKKVG